MLNEGRMAAVAFGVVVGLQAAVMCCAAGEAAAAALHAAANRRLRAAERRALGEGEFKEEEEEEDEDEGGGGGGDHAAPGNDDDDDDVEAGAVERRSPRERALWQLRKAREERCAASDARTLRLTHATSCALLLALLAHALLGYRSGTSTWVFPYSASAVTNRGRWLAILLCPLGSVARAALSRLNGRGRLGGCELPEWFKLGTFAANVTGCALNGLMKALKLGGAFGGGDGIAIFTAGWGTGVDGALTTVSTLASEIRRHRGAACVYAYPAVSVLCGLAAFLALYAPAMHNASPS